MDWCHSSSPVRHCLYPCLESPLETCLFEPLLLSGLGRHQQRSVAFMRWALHRKDSGALPVPPRNLWKNPLNLLSKSNLSLIMTLSSFQKCSSNICPGDMIRERVTLKDTWIEIYVSNCFSTCLPFFAMKSTHAFVASQWPSELHLWIPPVFLRHYQRCYQDGWLLLEGLYLHAQYRAKIM